MVDQFEEKKLEERILLIKRVTKKITGGSHITFVAVVAVGDRKGKVGVGMGKGREVPQAIRKAFTKAQKKMITIPMIAYNIIFLALPTCSSLPAEIRNSTPA